MGHPDAHKDSSASIREKEAKCELSIPYLRVKCVQNLGTLDLIKLTSKFRMVGKQGAGKPLCPLGNERRGELHQQCLYSHGLG